MAGSFKTEAIVLRSIRYGEADRVLHLYTADRALAETMEYHAHVRLRRVA